MAEWAVLTWQPVVWLIGLLEKSQVEVEEERKFFLCVAYATFFGDFVEVWTFMKFKWSARARCAVKDALLMV